MTRERELALIAALNNNGLFNEKQPQLRELGLAYWDDQRAECLTTPGYVTAQVLKERDEARDKAEAEFAELSLEVTRQNNTLSMLVDNDIVTWEQITTAYAKTILAENVELRSSLQQALANA